MQGLPHEGLLTALGEVSAAFVGFSLVVGIINARGERSPLEELRGFAVREVAEIGLVAVGASFLPLAIHAFGTSADSTWRTGSLVFIVLSSCVFFAAMLRRRRFGRQALRMQPVQNAIVALLNLGYIGLLALNVFAPGPSSGARYVAAILLLLAIAGLAFVFATFSDAASPPAA